MTSDLWNIILNIVAAFIYAGIVWLWQNRGEKPTHTTAPQPQPRPPAPTGTPYDHRAQNRQALEAAAQQFIFYLVTFALLYLSITMPPLFKAMLSKGDVLLSDARFIGDYLPAIPIGKSYLQLTFFACAAVLYWPLLAIAEVLTALIYPVIDWISPVTARIWSAIKMIFFMIFCIPVAATSIWLFYEKSYQDSVLLVLFVGIMAVAIGQAQSGRK